MAGIVLAAVVLLSLLAVAVVGLALWRQVKELGRATGAAAERIGEGTAALEAAQLETGPLETGQPAPRGPRPFP